MKIDYKPQFEVTRASILGHTGRTADEWFADLDGLGGVAAGRRVLGDYLFKEKKVDAWWVTTLLVEYEAARGALEKDGRPKGYNICVTKSIAAATGAVFDAFAAGKWLGADAKLDFAEGGRFADADGHAGSFKKISPGKVVRFTFEGKGHSASELVEIKLAAAGNKCSVVLTHDRIPDRAAADGLRTAWGEALSALKGQLE